MTSAQEIADDDTSLRWIAWEAVQAFDLPGEAAVRLLRQGNNTVFEVAAGGERFVLRVHRPGYRSTSQIESELRILSAIAGRLQQHAVRTPVPVAARDGRWTVSVPDPAVPGPGDGPLVCDLLTWVDGRVLRPKRGLGERASHDIGRGLALLHAALDEADLGEVDRPRWDLDGLVSDASHHGTGGLSSLRERLPDADRERVDDVIELAADTLDLLEEEDYPTGIIHGDFILLNCHLVREHHGWSVGIIDFDDCGWGHRLVDLAPLIENLADSPDRRRLITAFLAGYRSNFELPPTTEMHLPTLMALRQVSSCTWVVSADEAALPRPANELLAVRLEMMDDCLRLEVGAGSV